MDHTTSDYVSYKTLPRRVCKSSLGSRGSNYVDMKVSNLEEYFWIIVLTFNEIQSTKKESKNKNNISAPPS